MKNRNTMIIVLMLVSILVLVLGTLVVAQDSGDSQPDSAAPHSSSQVAASNSDSNPSGAPEVAIPAKYQSRADRSAEATTAETTTIYFTPQDENTSTTVLFLYNTGAAARTVSLRTFNINGGLTISTSISLPARTMVRISGDEPVTISPSWQDAVWVDFRTDSAYAEMTLPAGVKAEGFVVWNNSSIYDPLQAAPALPLRFSGDPLTVFLPSLPAN
jgi:hypothetical protein